MTVRTNVGNGNSYIDMDIQLVSADHDQYTYRAVIYLTSLNVSDSTNSCDVTGQWSRSGALSVGGVYNFTPVWSQDVSFPRYVGQDQVVGWNVWWSGVNYWGTTLSGTAYATVPGTTGKPSAPYAYSARNITTSSAYTTNVNADNVAGGTWNNLRVQWGQYPDMSNLTGDRTMGSFTDGYMDGLQPGRLYYFRVLVANGYMWSDPGAVTYFYAAAGIPATMAAPTISNITTTTATVNFVAPDNNGSTITSYGIEYATNSGFSPSSLVGSGALTGLSRGTQYWTRVRSQNGVGVSSWSAATAFTTLASVPDTMAAPSVSAIGNTTATVTYVAPADGGNPITGYTVQYATNAGFTTGVGTQASATTTANLTGLTAGTPYWTRVLATNATGNGAYSPATTFSSGATVPSAPAAPTISAVTDNSGTVTWVAPNGNGSAITGYEVNLVSGTSNITLAASASPLSVTGLQPVTTYQVKVRAINLIGTGTYSTATSTTTLSGLFLNVAGTFRRSELWMNVAGTWKVITLYVSVGGASKKIT